jgi:hypothetical protein
VKAGHSLAIMRAFRNQPSNQSLFDSLPPMTSPRNPLFLPWLRRLLGVKPVALDEIGRARALIRAIDAGGVPLNPARVNAIARDLGLEVSTRAAMEDTVQRIRAALKRV